MMEYLGLGSPTASGAPVCRYWCSCCKTESQYVDSAYITYPTTAAPSITSSSTMFWKSPWTTAAVSSGAPTVTYTYEPDED
jgi:hypothetical protein